MSGASHRGSFTSRVSSPSYSRAAPLAAKKVKSSWQAGDLTQPGVTMASRNVVRATCSCRAFLQSAPQPSTSRSMTGSIGRPGLNSVACPT